MPQAILTRYFPQTNHNPARIKVQGSGPRAPFLILPYHVDGCEGGYNAHRRAACLFATKFNWSGNWCAQEMANGWAFVNDPKISFSVPRHV